MRAVDPERLVIFLDPRTVDAIPLGVLRSGLDGRIAYANAAVQRLMGPELGVGVKLEEFEFVPGSREVLETNLQRRFDAHEASAYDVSIVRADRTRVHARIAGLPEYDAAGRIIGAVGIVVDKTMDRANLDLHAAISSASDATELLKALDGCLKEVVAYDSISVNQIGMDRSALRICYDRPEFGPQLKTAFRWWPMPAFVRADLDTILTTRPDDVKAMFSCEPYKALSETDPPTMEWLKLDYRHMLRKPIIRDGKLIALVSLLRKSDSPFTPEDVARVEQLPISETIYIAQAIEIHSELVFTLQLIHQLGAVAANIDEVGTILVESIRSYFGWDHVSLFRVSHDSQLISMVHQSALADAQLPPEYSQKINEGLLGMVATLAKPVRTGNVNATPGYMLAIEKTRSEMCLPIPGDNVRWILNVESALEGAFAVDEQGAVERLLAVAGLILDRTLAIEFNKTVLECSADAVIQTSTHGYIQYVNPACAQMLKRPIEALVGKHLLSFMEPAEQSGLNSATDHLVELMTHNSLAPIKVMFTAPDNSRTPVLLSGNALPPQIGGRVYVASDLSYQEHVQRMDALQAVFRQVASESRVPLSLAASFLEELLTVQVDEESVQLVKNSIAQLRRADLPLERVIRLASAPEGQELPLQTTDLIEIVNRLVSDLPPSHQRQIDFRSSDGALQVATARPEMEFCVNSALAFMLRMKAQRDGIVIEARQEGLHQVLDLALIDQSSKGPSSTRLEPRSDHERDFALAQPVIHDLMKRMRGTFEINQKDCFRIRLVFSTGGGIVNSWQLVAHPDSDVCEMALLAVQRALRIEQKMMRADTAYNIVESWERLQENSLNDLDLLVVSSALPEDDQTSIGFTSREPTKAYIKELKRKAPLLPIVVIANTPDERLADFLDAFDFVGLVTTGADFRPRLVDRIALLRLSVRDAVKASVEGSSPGSRRDRRGTQGRERRKISKPDSWIELTIHLGGHERGGWQMSRIGIDEFNAHGSLQVDRHLLETLIRHSKNLDELVASNSTKWLENLKELSDELRVLLFRSGRDNMDFWDRFLKHRERVGGVARSRVRVTVDDETHSMLFEALRDSQEEDDQFWVLNAPVFRRYSQQLSYPPLFKEKDEASHTKRINCLIIEADPEPGVIYNATGQPEKLSALDHLKTEAKRVLAILDQHAGGTVKLVRVGEGDKSVEDVLAELRSQHWHVVHFCGHVVGDDRNPALVLRADQEHLLSVEAFAQVISKTQLLFLSSCRSASTRIVMHAVERHVSAVVGFQWVIDDQAACNFAIDFYTQLFDDANPHARDLEYAHLKARREAYERKPLDPSWVAPVLVMQMG